MALKITEAWKSGEGEVGKDSHDVYIGIVSGDPDPHVDNADDPYTAYAFAIRNFSWVSPFGNVLSTIERQRTAVGVWTFTATYKSPVGENRQSNDVAFSFCTGGGSQHITKSRMTVAFGIPDDGESHGGDVAADYKGAIGVSGNEITGVDVEVEVFDFKVTFYLPPDKLTTTFINQLYILTKRVNSDHVALVVDGVQMFFKPGELRYISAEGSKRVGFGDWELTLNFSAIPNTVIPIYGRGNVVKRGWDYVWYGFAAVVDTDANVLTQRPIGVYIEQVYDYQPLSGLFLPGIFGQNNGQFWASPGLVSAGGIR